MALYQHIMISNVLLVNVLILINNKICLISQSLAIIFNHYFGDFYYFSDIFSFIWPIALEVLMYMG